MRRRIPVYLSTRTCVDLAVADTLALASELGYDGVEVWVDDLLRSEAAPEEVCDAAAACGLTLSVHAPSYDLNPTSTNRGIREESLRQVLSSLELAADLGATVITVHPGQLSSRADLPESYWPAQRDFFSAAFRRAAELGVVASAEHMERGLKHIFGTPADVARLREAAGSAGLPFAYTLDVAHCHTHGIPVADFLQVAGMPRHVHLSDASAEKTHHGAMGEGTTDIHRGLRELLEAGYPHAIAIEGVARGRARAAATSNLRLCDEVLSA